MAPFRGLTNGPVAARLIYEAIKCSLGVGYFDCDNGEPTATTAIRFQNLDLDRRWFPSALLNVPPHLIRRRN